MLIDLDRFKEVNYCLGHDAGDKLLVNVSNCLNNILRGDDTLSRAGGDEFMVVLNTLNTFDEAKIIARKLVKAVERINCPNNNDLHVTCSIGIAMYPDHGNNKEALIKNADIAMYRAKRDGKDTFCLFEEEKPGQIKKVKY